MSQQIYFFKKNIIDLDNTNATVTVTDGTASNTGQSIVDYIRNRNNYSAWVTTGSNDASNTQLDIFFGDERTIDRLFLILHNFDSYTIQYFNGSNYVDFSTAISVTGSTETVSTHTFTAVATTKIRIIIQGTQVADADKKLRQLIVTETDGQLNGWPVIKKPQHSTNKQVSRMLSGKVHVTETIGAFSCQLKVDNWSDSTDLSIVEEIYFGRRGVLVWLGGGDETQFKTLVTGYRKQDLFFMRAINEYTPELANGLYKSGYKIELKLEEAIT